MKEDKLALVIGISGYPDESNLKALSYGAKDAADLKSALDGQGYKTDILQDQRASRRYILNKLEELGKRVKPGSGTIIFSFSGHGAEPKGQEAGPYFATWGVASEHMEEGLSLYEVRDLLLSFKARRVMMFVDACRDMTPPKAKGGVGGPRRMGELANSAGIKIFLSTGPGKESFEDDDLKNGIFTHFMVDALTGKAPEASPDGLVSFDDLVKYVTKAVKTRKPAQEPYVGGESVGDFYVAGQPKPEIPRRAFLVGINHYERPVERVVIQNGNPVNVAGKETHDLKGAVSDAENMEAQLKASKFETTRVQDGIKLAELKGRFNDFVKTLGTGDVALFYFAGDGSGCNRDAFALASDAEVTDDHDRADVTRGTECKANIGDQLAISSVLDSLAANRTGPNILILDMCLTGIQESDLRQRLRKANSFVFLATRPGSFAYERPASERPAGGIMTTNLLDLMKTPGLSINDISVKLTDPVLQETKDRQAPWSIGTLKEQFYFTPAAK